jgi:hypothetical protein
MFNVVYSYNQRTTHLQVLWVDISGVTSNEPSTKVKVYNLTLSTIIINAGLGSGVAYNYTFNAVYGNAYLIEIRDF